MKYRELLLWLQSLSKEHLEEEVCVHDHGQHSTLMLTLQSDQGEYTPAGIMPLQLAEMGTTSPWPTHSFAKGTTLWNHERNLWQVQLESGAIKDLGPTPHEKFRGTAAGRPVKVKIFLNGPHVGKVEFVQFLDPVIGDTIETFFNGKWQFFQRLEWPAQVQYAKLQLLPDRERYRIKQ